MNFKRRNLLGWLGLGTIINFLLHSCQTNQPSSDPSSSPVPRADGFKVIGQVSDLKKNGFILNKDKTSEPILVTASPKLIAVNPICSHQGCLVQWNKDKKILSCPCHGAQFSLDGKVLLGPAETPLNTFSIKQEKDLILVKYNDENN